MTRDLPGQRDDDGELADLRRLEGTVAAHPRKPRFDVSSARGLEQHQHQQHQRRTVDPNRQLTVNSVIKQHDQHNGGDSDADPGQLPVKRVGRQAIQHAEQAASVAPCVRVDGGVGNGDQTEDHDRCRKQHQRYIQMAAVSVFQRQRPAMVSQHIILLFT